MIAFVSHNVNCLFGEIPCQGLVVITINLVMKSHVKLISKPKKSLSTCYDGKALVNIFPYTMYCIPFVVGTASINSTQTCKGC